MVFEPFLFYSCQHFLYRLLCLLSDASLAFTRALRLPTFDVEGMTLLRRLTLVLADRAVQRVLYPVFPPDRAAADALAVVRG